MRWRGFAAAERHVSQGYENSQGIVMKLAPYAISIMMMGCVGNSPTLEPAGATPSREAAEERSLSQRIYHLQHKVIARWVFESECAFYTDLRHGDIDQLLSAAEEIVTPEYARGMHVTPIENREAVLIAFPPPYSPPNCYYAIVEKVGDGFRYFTYESTIGVGNVRAFGAVGGWDGEGNHYNYGPRTYRGPAEFAADVLGEK